MHTTTTTLNTKEFNKVSDDIIQTLYALSPDMQDLYDIHINYIEDSWQIDFLPQVENMPALKATGYISYENNGAEVLRVNPQELTDFPNALSLSDRDKSYDRCVNYYVLFDFIISLYDFEYMFR